jgi:hypothetical protein
MDSKAYGKEFEDIWGLLAAPFTEDEIKTRSQAGRQLQYVTARSVMNRLDDVVGPANWWDDFVPLEHAVICRLTIRLPDGTTITKSDAGGYAGMADPGDDDKSGFADAIKRAAVKFGVGRHLYGDGVPMFARRGFPNGSGEPSRRNGDVGGSPPPRPQPSSPPPSNGSPRSQQASQPQRQYDDSQAPRDGRGLFAWAMKKAEDAGTGKWSVVNDIQAIANEQGWDVPQKLGDWPAEYVAMVWPILTGSAN